MKYDFLVETYESERIKVVSLWSEFEEEDMHMQQMAMLRMLGRNLHSNYGPTADTGGLMQNQASTIYAYSSFESLLEGEAVGGAKAALPGPGVKPVTERPE
jgi:hypothetical protein